MGILTTRPQLLSLLISLVFAIAPPISAAERPASAWVYPGPDGKLVYKTTPAGDRILDFSHAGYMGGGVAIPELPIKQTIKPSGTDDDAAIIQKAIDELAAQPLEERFRGAVLLSPGTFNCPTTITIPASGIVLRGSGAHGADKTTLKLTGRPHLAISARTPRARGNRNQADDTAGTSTTIADAYVPSGSNSFTVVSAAGFAVGDTVAIRRPITPAWVRFMQMHDLVRDGRPQTWIRAGTTHTAERTITAIAGNRIIIDVPLADSYDAEFLNPPGTNVVKLPPSSRLAQVGIENLHIESPPQPISHTERHFTAIRMSGQDSWIRDVVCDETMNSIAVSGKRITLQRVAVNRKALHQGSSKPAEFAPNGTQVLMDRCTSSADNVWYAGVGGGVSGPVVLLNCTFTGNGRAESHQRWSTGLLYDNCRAENGGLDFRNRGSMGSGHGWSMGWGVAWNCTAKDFIIQNPPGSMNWMIGCIGQSTPKPRPFGNEPVLPEGTIDSPDKPVAPQSLYLTQLQERLGPQALRNIGY